MQTLAELTDYWKTHGDKPATHLHIRAKLMEMFEADEKLVKHRRHVTSRALGMGDDSFSAMWRLIVESMPQHFSFLEIGVHCGQIISLIELLAERSGKSCEIFGVSPFDGREVNPNGEDFKAHTLKLFDELNLLHPYLITGDSTEQRTIGSVNQFAPFDVVFVDGSHLFEAVKSDILSYGPMVKVGGLLVMDDSACLFKLPPCCGKVNWFHGIDPVARAVDKLLPPHGSGMPTGEVFEHIAVIMHDRLFKRIA